MPACSAGELPPCRRARRGAGRGVRRAGRAPRGPRAAAAHHRPRAFRYLELAGRARRVRAAPGDRVGRRLGHRRRRADGRRRARRRRPVHRLRRHRARVAQEVPRAARARRGAVPDALGWARNERSTGSGVDLRQGDAAGAPSPSSTAGRPRHLATRRTSRDGAESVTPRSATTTRALALFAGGDGLDVIRGVERTAHRLLRRAASSSIEHADTQGGAGAVDLHRGRAGPTSTDHPRPRRPRPRSRPPRAAPTARIDRREPAAIDCYDADERDRRGLREAASARPPRRAGRAADRHGLRHRLPTRSPRGRSRPAAAKGRGRDMPIPVLVGSPNTLRRPGRRTSPSWPGTSSTPSGPARSPSFASTAVPDLGPGRHPGHGRGPDAAAPGRDRAAHARSARWPCPAPTAPASRRPRPSTRPREQLGDSVSGLPRRRPTRRRRAVLDRRRHRRRSPGRCCAPARDRPPSSVSGPWRRPTLDGSAYSADRRRVEWSRTAAHARTSQR